MTTVARRLALLALATALITGCTDDGGDEPTATAPQASAPTGSQSPGSDPDSDSDGGSDGSGAGVEDVDLDAVIATQTVALIESPEDEVDLGVLSLEVEGDVMQLRMAITPRFTSRGDGDSIDLVNALDRTSFRPVLFDVDNLKQYNVVTGTGLSLLASSSVTTRSRNGSPMLAYAYFAAHEDDIDAIEVRLTDFWPAFTDVPIAR